MKKTILILVVIMLMVFVQNTWADKFITGVVYDNANHALPGVTVLEKGTSNETYTDINGKYTIVVSDSAKHLVFSFIGMKSKEVRIKNNLIVNVVLESSSYSVNEVVVLEDDREQEECVVVGYGVKKRSVLTGAVSKSVSRQKVEQVNYLQPSISREDYAEINTNKFLDPKESPLSTFSVDVDKASYSNIRRFLNNGVMPPKDAVRIEEMINYFDYNYDGPKNQQPFAVHHEVALCPWNRSHYLMQVALQGKRIEKENLPPSNLVFLIDVSGSMNSNNKLPLLKSALKMLVNELREEDKVSIVVYAGAAGVVLNPTSGKEKRKIIDALDKLSAGGSTAGGAGLKLAYKLAHENYLKKGNNRIILATDGDFNVGLSSNQEMEKLIESERENGIYITVTGFGIGNYKDSKMEIIADKGNGNYFYIDNFLEAKKALVEEFGGTLYTIAKDVKFQLEFNPEYVAAYRLIGYENRMLNKEDFNNDRVDAGEIGSGHSVTALYEIIPVGTDDIGEYIPGTDPLKYQREEKISIPLESLSDELLTIKVRYKLPDENSSKLITVPVLNRVKRDEDVSGKFSFVSCVAVWGMKLRGDYYVNDMSFENIERLLKDSEWHDEQGYCYEMLRLINCSKQLSQDVVKK